MFAVVIGASLVHLQGCGSGLEDLQSPDGAEFDRRQNGHEVDPTCSVEEACGSGQVLNYDLELLPGRTCPEVLLEDGGWVCQEGSNHEHVAFFKNWCCYDEGEDPPQFPEVCDVESVCGAGAQMPNPGSVLWGESTCESLLDNGWVCRESSAGVYWFKKKCCTGWYDTEGDTAGKCVGDGCCLANACGPNIPVPDEHKQTIVWHGRSCVEIQTEESVVSDDSFMCDLNSAWGNHEGAQKFRDTCCH